MTALLGGILGGLGLFFVGMWLLSENLKAMSSRRLRVLAANWTPNRFVAFFYGLLAGAVTQSMAALSFVTIGTLRANLTTTERAFPFIAGGNVGVASLVFLVSFNIELAALYVLGATSVVVLSDRAVKFRSLGVAMFGMALMFVGLALIKESASSFSGQPWFEEFLLLMDRSLWISFLLAVILCFVVQSAVAVMVFGISMASAEVLNTDQVMMIIYGATLGSSLTVLAFSFNLTGVSRRLAMFQVSFNIASCVVFVPMLYIENWTGIPLMKALILSIPLELGHELGLLSFLTDVSTGIVLLIMMPFAVQLFSRLWPSTAAERITQIQFIHDRAHGDPALAMDLISLEQRRLLTTFSSYLNAARQRAEIEPLRESTRLVIRETNSFLEEVTLRHPMQNIQSLNSILAQQRLITWLEEQLAELCLILNQLPDDTDSSQLRDNLIEGMDAVMLVLADALNSGDAEEWAMAREITGDRTELMRRIQISHLGQQTSLSETERFNILKATNTAGEVFFLLSRIAQEIESFSLLPVVSQGPRPAPRPVSPEAVADRNC